MINYIGQFQQYKDKIPEFIVKLYHILESKEYSDYMSWNSDAEIIIKNGKKLEEKVLPYFFRHRHLSSFVRQLNMYKFSKVNKLTKEKNQMYFRNEYFKRGLIKEMVKIKRNSKKNKKQQMKEEELEGDELEEGVSNDHSELSINKELENNTLLNYKQYVKNAAREISENLKKIQMENPEMKAELTATINLCSELMENEQVSELQNQVALPMNLDQTIQNKNMLSTMKLLPRMESLIFPSQCSFYQFN